MTQLGLFGAAPAPASSGWGDLLVPAPKAHPSRAPVPRWYQEECDQAIDRAFLEHDTTMALLATGLGKSVIAARRVKKTLDAGGSALVMAHRNELVTQMAAHIERATGEYVEIEQAELRASAKARLVVASTPSLSQVRLERLGKKRFDLVIADEFHHYLCPSFRRAWEWFACKRLGITATADRGDEAALEQICESVAYCFDITDGIDAGYLVPILGEQVLLASIDLTGVKVSGGELVAAQLDDVMVKAADGVVQKLLELAPNRRGPIFLPGVRSAEYVAERLNAFVPMSCGLVSGDDSWSPRPAPDGTPVTRERMPDKADRRKEVIRQARAGELRWLANCAVLTEGFDWPEADVVVMGHPMMTRSGYAQRAGRGTRVAPGVVDGIEGKAGAAARRAAIAASSKPNMLLLDFGGNAGRHSLCSPADLLGGNYTEVEVEEAKRAAKKGGAQDVRALLEAARKTLRAVAEREASKVQAKVVKFDPFTSMGLEEEDGRYSRRFGHKQLSTKQFEFLTKWGMGEQEAQRLSKQEASRAIDELLARKAKRLAELPQLRALAEHGIVDPNITRDAAIKVLDYLHRNKRRVDMEAVKRMISNG